MSPPLRAAVGADGSVWAAVALLTRHTVFAGTAPPAVTGGGDGTWRDIAALLGAQERLRSWVRVRGRVTNGVAATG